MGEGLRRIPRAECHEQQATGGCRGPRGGVGAVALHESGGPADADKQTIRPAYTDFVEAPLPVWQDAPQASGAMPHTGF